MFSMRKLLPIDVGCRCSGQGRLMRRLDFIALLASAAVWPFTVSAQQAALPVIGFLGAASESENTPFTAGFIRGLKEAGFVERRNVVIEYRWAEGHYDRLQAMVADFVRQQVAVIFTAGGAPPLRAAIAATKTIPIIFNVGDDPVGGGYVASLNRPGGNVTGVNFLAAELAAKRFELLRELLPKATQTALLVNPDGRTSELEGQRVEAAARAVGHEVLALNANSARDIEIAFATLVEHRASAVLVTADAFFVRQRGQIAELAARYNIPTVTFEREFVVAGALMSYGASLRDSYYQAGLYAGRILKGAKPADLPVVQATRIELVINLKTAKTLGLEIPAKVLALADEVIE
jgi:putative tryptophan/tyrosine transport system substrate-binding protein